MNCTSGQRSDRKEDREEEEEEKENRFLSNVNLNEKSSNECVYYICRHARTLTR